MSLVIIGVEFLQKKIVGQNFKKEKYFVQIYGIEHLSCWQHGSQTWYSSDEEKQLKRTHTHIYGCLCLPSFQWQMLNVFLLLSYFYIILGTFDEDSHYMSC